jgi:putative ABC transport system ATP-binding protein
VEIRARLADDLDAGRRVSPLIEARGLCRDFKQGGQTVEALRDVDLRIEPGEFAVVTGESGSGKSTLLSLLGALDRPDRGSIRFRGEALQDAPAARLTRFRLRHIGFVFQDFRLVRHLSALENARLPLLFSGHADRASRAIEQLESLNLGQRLHHRPDSLSRGEMQRVALVRALINEPDVLLADEPTANLDRRNSEQIWNFLRDCSQSRGLTVVVATHNPDLVRDAGRVIRLQDGRVVHDARG